MSENQQTADLAAKLERMAEAFTAAPHHVRLKRSDGELVQSAVATIEALRRRVAELEGELSEEREGSKKAVAEIAKMHKWADKVIAENAELKRQVEALREDAEVGALVREALSHDDRREIHIEREDETTWAIDLNPSEIDGIDYACNTWFGRSLVDVVRTASKCEMLQVLRAAKGEVE